MRLAFAALAALVLAGLGRAAAAPLDEAACAALRAARDSLVANGVQSDMARGPEWGKANLAPDRLKEVARLIEVDEQIAFRCPRPKAVAQPKEKAPAKKGTAGAPAGAPKSEASEAAGSDGAAAKAASETVNPTRKKDAAKARAQDAYVPPPETVGATVPTP
jgi:hypothetical protein